MEKDSAINNPTTDKEKRRRKKKSVEPRKGSKADIQTNCLSGILGIFIVLTVVLTVLLFLCVTRFNGDSER